MNEQHAFDFEADPSENAKALLAVLRAAYPTTFHPDCKFAFQDVDGGLFSVTNGEEIPTGSEEEFQLLSDDSTQLENMPLADALSAITEIINRKPFGLTPSETWANGFMLGAALGLLAFSGPKALDTHPVYWERV